MSEQLAGWKRTCMCGEIDLSYVGKKVTLMGWTQRRRDMGGLIFVDLRDRTGIVQIVFNENKNTDFFEKAESLKNEYVLAVSGEVVRRSEETVNPKIPTGEIEVQAHELKILSPSATPPFAIEPGINVSENLRLKYRYLDLRRSDLQEKLIFRHNLAKWVRGFLDKEGFLEIETPVLTKSTPEGARDYLVPSRVHHGKFYALPQSPQLFKQLLMLSGYDKYFQIVKCFRDEDLRADRQPEFTQIDIEMSFVEAEDVLAMNEKMLALIFENAFGIPLKLPIERLTYKEAMERFGSDKPDLRFGLELKDITDIVENCEYKVFRDSIAKGGKVRALNAETCGEKMARREIDALVDLAKTYRAKGLGWMVVDSEGVKSPISKFLTEQQISAIQDRLNAKPGDLLLFVADVDSVALYALGQLRLEFGKRLGLMSDDDFKFVWVTEFPLLEYDDEAKRYVAKHHPFTSPMDEDIDLLESDPSKVRAKAYDIVLNGVEIGGGSIRIHSSLLQERMFKALGFTNEQAWDRFGFLLEAFKYGAPPHGGIAYGFDRMVMLFTKSESIRDVIAFPKIQNASDPMVDAPSYVDKSQLKELNIEVTKEESI
jgi:aspartyl-tRNA synthetase